MILYLTLKKSIFQESPKIEASFAIQGCAFKVLLIVSLISFKFYHSLHSLEVSAAHLWKNSFHMHFPNIKPIRFQQRREEMIRSHFSEVLLHI